MKDGSAAKLIVDALLQRFLPLARRHIETAQAQFWAFDNSLISRFEKKKQPRKTHVGRVSVLPLKRQMDEHRTPLTEVVAMLVIRHVRVIVSAMLLTLIEKLWCHQVSGSEFF